MTTAPARDFANNKLAQRNRDEKAKKIARALYEDGWSAEAARDFTDPERTSTARQVGVRAPSSITWDRVIELLALRYQHDAWTKRQIAGS